MAEGTHTSPSSPRLPGHRSWRPKAPAAGPRYDWQRQGRRTFGAALRSRGGRRIYTAMLFGLAGALLVWLVAELLYAPARTPLIAVTATAYDWPLAPNAWAAEDIDGLLHHLDQHTIRLLDLRPDWRSAERGLARLDEALENVVHRRGRARTVALYLSMPGAVDGQGRACLIPPGASPHDSSTWLPLATVLERVKQSGLPAGVHKLLILDVSRQPVNWNMGQLAEAFLTAIPDELAEAKVPQLAILTSSGAGETACASPALRGTVFGHYLRLGLAGAADASDAGGDANGIVSLAELRSYLSRHVHAWTMHHLGVPQTPTVFPATANFGIAWAMQTRVWRDMVDQAGRLEPANPAIAVAQRAALWRKLDGLRAARPWRFAPLAWRDLEQRLLWLEQLSAAGKEYETQASAVQTQLADDLEQAERRYAAARTSQALPDYAAVLGAASRLPKVNMHSLPLAGYWGVLERDTLLSLETVFERCEQVPSRQELAAAIAAVGEANLPLTLEEANFLAICQRLHVPDVWRDQRPLREVLAVRRLAEAAAAPPAADDQLPGDERAQSWVRSPLAPLDHARRELEDEVLLGPQRGGGLASGEDLLAGLRGLSIGQRAAQIFAQRDELWSELPYLAQWLCRPQFDADRQEAADAAIRQTLLPLVAAGLDLERQLARGDELNGDRAWTADSAAKVVEQKLAELRALVAHEIDACLAATEGAGSIREIDALLALPAIPWSVREQLVVNRRQLHLKQVARYDPFDAAERIVPPASAPLPHLARVLRWQPHPLALLLDQESPAPGSGELSAREDRELCAALGEACRHRLAALSTTDWLHAASDSRPRTDTAAAPVAGRGQLAAAESRLRRAAALWFPRPGIDPVAELRRADLQDYFHWRAARAMDDFTGAASAGGEPLFATLAADFLAAAQALGPLSESAAAEAARLESLLARRRIAARDALAVRASDILLVDVASRISSTLAVAPRTPEAVPDLPHAKAATFLADDRGRIGEQSLPLSLTGDQVAADRPLLTEQVLLETADLHDRGPILRAIATIRGNDFSAPVVLRAPGGARVEFVAPAYSGSTITVLGHEQKRASVVFILDCSQSMQAPATIEAPDATARTPATRMEVAKRALVMLLGDLADRGSLRVGVRLFGHRVGWSTTVADKLLRQTDYGEEIPAALRPYADVQQILPLGRFDASAAAQVFDKLQTVRAWGESPLYLAIRQAIDDFGPDDSAARSIVVITDGRNYQFNPPPEFQASASAVAAAAQRANVAIQIVGFDLSESEAGSVRGEFTDIASRTGGSYVPAAGATALLETLQRLLGPGEFRVAAASGAPAGSAPLGHPVALPLPAGRQQYDVTYQRLQAPVEIAGGEAVEFVVRRGEPRLEVPPYLQGSPRFEPLVAANTGGRTPLAAGVHRAVRLPGGVEFPLSVQHADGRFLPRPVEVWVEIVPLGLPEEESPGPFIFYDAPFVAGTSVPVLRLVARQWPANSTKAEVRAWFKSESSPTTEERALVDVADRLPEGAEGFSIAGLSGVSYQVRTSGGSGQPLLVGLIERHERAATVGTLKVTLTPPPGRAAHQFDPRNRLVVHTFVFEQRTIDRGQVTVEFTTRDAALSHSVHTVQPTIVDVSDRSDLLETVRTGPVEESSPAPR